MGNYLLKVRGPKFHANCQDLEAKWKEFSEITVSAVLKAHREKYGSVCLRTKHMKNLCYSTITCSIKYN